MPDYMFLKKAIQKMMAYYSIPGCAIAIIDHDDVSSFQFGYGNKDKRELFTTNTISGIGSCAKSMTAFAVLRLAEKGILDIDVPVASYISGFTLWDDTASRAVTIRDMLCHRTGLGGHDGTWPDNHITRVEFLRRLRYMEPNAPFRTLAQYSNVMYVAVGGIMEVLTGKKWEEIMEEEIFRPLGMDKTFCLMEDAAKQKNCAEPYWWDKGLHAVSRWNIDMAGPCGSIMSTASDMAKWLSMHIKGGLWGGRPMLSSGRFHDMHEPQTLMTYPHIKGGRALGYGLGWRVMEYYGHVVQQHTGKIEGYSAFQFYVPEIGKGAVYLQNLHAPLNPFIFTIQGLLLDYFTGRKQQDWISLFTEKGDHAPEAVYHQLEFNCMPPKAVPHTKPIHELVDYVGAYKNPAYGLFTVVLEKGRLWLHEREVRYRPMTHFHYETFQVDQIKEDTDLYTCPLTFFTDTDTGAVGGFTLRMEPKVRDVLFTKIKK